VPSSKPCVWPNGTTLASSPAQHRVPDPERRCLGQSHPQQKLEQDAAAEANNTLHQWLVKSGAASDAQVLVDVGAPIDCILRRVRETKADLLVLGVSGSSMIPMGAGTLATKCLRKVPAKS